MSAPYIPNLLTARGEAGRLGRGRGRGRGSSSSYAAEESAEDVRRRKDEVVRQTDDDANASRLSAVAIGLLEDPYARFFGDLMTAPRRMPIINRGTYVRTRAIDKLVGKFAQSCARSGREAQVISLGAGSDTRVFNLIAQGVTKLIYHEIDLPANVLTKLANINKHTELRKVLTVPESEEITEKSFVGSSDGGVVYQIQSLDLRDMGARQLEPGERGHRPDAISPDIPTLILSECCLCYLEPSIVSRVIDCFISPQGGVLSPTCPVALAVYEPVNPSDSFGITMVRNLQQRGLEMPTLSAFPTLNSQRERMREYGFTEGSKAVDINRALSMWFTQEERERLNRINPLDELEEWQMLAQHYCISWGWKGSMDWRDWEELPE